MREAISIVVEDVVTALAGFVIGGVIVVIGFVILLWTTDFGYHRLSVQNESDSTILVDLRDPASDPSHSAVPPHSSATIKGSRFRAPTTVWFTDQSDEGVSCSMSWHDAASQQPFVFRTLDAVCCPPAPTTFCVRKAPLIGPQLDPAAR